MFFISSMPLDISFQIRHVHLEKKIPTYNLAIELEDDLIATRKWKSKILSGASTRFFPGVTNNTEAML